MKKLFRISFLSLTAAAVLAGCSQYARVSEVRPVLRVAESIGGVAKELQGGISSALQIESRDPSAALGGFLETASAASAQFTRNPKDTVARDAYNFAVARAIDTINRAKLDPWSQPLRVPATGGEFVLVHKLDPRPGWNPALYDLTPADRLNLSGDYIRKRTIKEGIGAPLVAVSKQVNKHAGRDFTNPRIYYGVTAVIRFQGRRASIALEDPLATERVNMNGASFPLAADFTGPVAVMLASTNPKKIEIPRLLKPEKYAETARIFRLEPYDPKKTVVLVIHGLMDSPATWSPMINELRADEHIRRKYQFWFYSYPSGYPFPYSASILRDELDAIEKRYPLRKPMVVVGHSMGGCISRLLVTDTGDKIWMDSFGKPPSEVPMSAGSKKLLMDALVFKHRSEVGRVIFMAAPLRGAELAESWIGRLGSKVVSSPAKLLTVGREAVNFVTFQSSVLRLKHVANSVDTLAPSNRFVKSINTLPIVRHIPYHTIVGDRGKGGNKDHTKPVMSDGVVPYWSSHLEGAKSELIVPSNHSVHQNPEAIAEVSRILKVHAGR